MRTATNWNAYGLRDGDGAVIKPDDDVGLSAEDLAEDPRIEEEDRP